MSKRFDPHDSYFRRAKAEGFRARSAFKLSEILGRERLVRKGSTVLDLGAAPGGFLQVLANKVGTKGHVVGVDLTPIQELPGTGVTTIQGDVEDEKMIERLRSLHPVYDVVVSDMAPATTGSSATDAARSHRLVERTLEIASELLRPGGGLIAKAFMGPGFDELVETCRRRFRSVRVARPKATRERSKECFLVARGFRKDRET